VEEGNLSTSLAFDCGHGYAEEQYAVCRQITVLLLGEEAVALPSNGNTLWRD